MYRRHASLEKLVQNALPGWRRSDLGTEGIDVVPVKLTSASINVNLAHLLPTSAFPEVPNNPESNNDGEAKIRLEETLGVVETGFPRWAQGNIELNSKSACHSSRKIRGDKGVQTYLSNQNQDAQEEADP